MPGVSQRDDLPAVFVEDLIGEFYSGPFPFFEPDPDHDPIVVFDFSLIARPSFDDGEFEPRFFEAFICETAVSAPCSACLLEPIEVVRIVGVAHHVGFAIADTHALFSHGLHEWVIPSKVGRKRAKRHDGGDASGYV